jgi:hypothetical protein
MAGETGIEFERLLEWVEGRLPEEEAQSVARQVARAGPAVQARVKWLRAFLRLGEQVQMDAPPPSLRANLVQRFADYARAGKQPGLFQQITAALAFDSAFQQPALGMRSAGDDAQRQLVFSARLAEIALDILPHAWDQKLDLLGQILPRDERLEPGAFAVQLLLADREVSITMADDLGEFIFEGLEPGNYRLLITTDVLEIDLPIVRLTRDPDLPSSL